MHKLNVPLQATGKYSTRPYARQIGQEIGLSDKGQESLHDMKWKVFIPSKYNKDLTCESVLFEVHNIMLHN